MNIIKRSFLSIFVYFLLFLIILPGNGKICLAYKEAFENNTTNSPVFMYEKATDSLQTNTIKTNLETQEPLIKISPRHALLKSLLLPGWGQFYNNRYIKGSIIAGIESFFLLKIWYETDRANQNLNLSRLHGETVNDFENGDAPYYSGYSRHFDKRLDCFWFLGILLLYSSVDAYVDAYLQEFDNPIEELKPITISFCNDGTGCHGVSINYKLFF